MKKNYWQKKIYQLIPKKKIDYLKYYLDFLFAMTEKEIKARYKRAVFGFLWIIINPVLQMFVIGTVFSFFINIPNYFIFLFMGLLLWQFFSLSVGKATSSIVNERALLFKAKFPTEVIPLSIIIANFFHLLISFLIFLPVVFVFGTLGFVSIIWLLIVLIWIFLLSVSVVLITASLNVRFRDVSFFIQTILLLWFYMTPVIYDLTLIPVGLQNLFILNPLSSVFEILHVSFLGRGIVNVHMVVSNLSITVTLLTFGIILWRKESKYFVDWL